MSAPGKPTPAAKAPSPAAVAEIEHLLARGKARRAVERAKDLHKACRSPQSEALLVRAYHGRIEEMLRQNQTREAQVLLDLVRERYPGNSGLCADLRERQAVRTGTWLDELARLAAADLTDAERERLEGLIRRNLADPRQVADYAGLPVEHPLRLEAAAIARALTAVTAGPVTDADLALPEVSRQSPLAAWKLFVRAVARFHQRQDEDCRRCLAALAPDSAPARLAPVLEDLLAGKSPRGTGGVVRLAMAISGDTPALHKALASLDAGFRSGRLRTVQEAVAGAVQECRRCRPELLDRLRQHIAACAATVDIPDDDLRVALGASPVRDANYWRLFARANEVAARNWGHELVFDACAAWEEFRRHAVHQGWFAADSPEEAAVYLHMADLLSSLPMEDASVLGDIEKEFRDSGGMAYYYAKSEKQPASVMACAPRSPPDTYFLYPDELFARACRASPSSERFQRWLDWTRGQDLGPRAEERVADAWHQTCPDDPRPLVVLMESAEARDALGKALKYLTAAEALDRMSPDVRIARPRLLVATALRHLRKKQLHLLADDLTALAALPQMAEGDRPILTAAIRWAGAALRTFPVSVDWDMADLVAVAGDRLTAVGAAGVVAHSIKAPGLGEAVTDTVTQAEAESDLALRGVARVRELCLELHLGFAMPARWLEAMPAACQHGVANLTDAHLRSLATFALTCRNAGRNRTAGMAMAPLVYRLAGHGLKRPEADQAHFLLLRGKSLLIEDARAPQRGIDCLRAARTLATRHRDMALVEQALDAERRYRYLVRDPSGFRDDTEEQARLMGAEEVQRVLTTERAAGDFPALPLPRYDTAPTTRRGYRRRPALDDRRQGLLPGFGERLGEPAPEDMDDGVAPVASTEELEDWADTGAEGDGDDGLPFPDDDGFDDGDAEAEEPVSGAMLALMSRLLEKYGEKALDLIANPKVLARKDPALFREMLKIVAESGPLPDIGGFEPPPPHRGRKR